MTRLDYSTQAEYSKNKERVEEFKNLFYTLSSLWRDIILEYHWRCNKHRVVFIGQKKMAEKVGCSIRTVGACVKFMKQVGWLSSCRRYRQTSITFLAKWLLQLDIKNSRTFALSDPERPTIPIYDLPRELPINSYHLSYPSFRKEQNVTVKPFRVRKNEPYSFLEDMGLSYEDRQAISMYSENVVTLARESCMLYVATNPIRKNLAALMMNSCKYHASRQNESRLR